MIYDIILQANKLIFLVLR